ncbi:MAG: MaoC family dehydratase [Alphaproteobacteria bacterium]
MAAAETAASAPRRPLPARVLEELSGYFFEDLEVGMTAAYARTIGAADLVLFAGISGDTNPMHLNEEYAAQTMFEGTIAHGFLSGSFISTVIGTRLPGPGCVYLGQTLRFKAPVRPGDTVTARATVTKLNPDRARATLQTVCTVGDIVVIDGEADVMVPRRPKPRTNGA